MHSLDKFSTDAENFILSKSVNSFSSYVYLTMSYLIFKFQGDGDGERPAMITSLPHFCPKSQQIRTDGFRGRDSEGRMENSFVLVCWWTFPCLHISIVTDFILCDQKQLIFHPKYFTLFSKELCTLMILKIDTCCFTLAFSVAFLNRLGINQC